MVNYQQGKIYKICSLQTDKIYIGSTCKETLAQRMAIHRAHYKGWKNGKKHFITSFDLLDKYDDCEIILIENFPCNNKDELRKRERFHIEQFINICVNKVIPSRSKNEYRKVNKEKTKEYHEAYREANKEKLDNYNLKYRIENFEKIQQKRHETYEKNKEKILEIQNKEIKCECGKVYHGHKTRHEKSIRHQKYIKQIE